VEWLSMLIRGRSPAAKVGASAAVRAVRVRAKKEWMT